MHPLNTKHDAASALSETQYASFQAEHKCLKRDRVWYKVPVSSSARATEIGTRLYFLPAPFKTMPLCLDYYSLPLLCVFLLAFIVKSRF